MPIQNQPGRPPFDIHLENFEYVSSKYSLDEICACLELRYVFKLKIHWFFNQIERLLSLKTMKSEEELNRTFFDKVWPGQMEYYYQ